LDGVTEKIIINDLLKIDYLSQIIKIFILISAIGVVLILISYSKIVQSTAKFEFSILILLAVLGMCLLVSSNNLLSMYIALELQAMSLYVLLAFRKDHPNNSESAIKYFVLSSLSSALILYGCSFIYGVTGNLSFSHISQIISSYAVAPNIFVIGMILVLIGLFFKLSLIPFHMWTPDVYQGASIPITAFFAATSKIAAVILLIKLLYNVFDSLFIHWQQILMILSAISMLFGSIAAIAQTNIKRMLAYSSIAHMGYVTMGITAYSTEAVESVIIYLFIYLSMTIGMFASLLFINRKELHDKQVSFLSDIKYFSGLGKKSPYKALIITIFMLSMAGLPPFAGFWGKLFIFKAVIASELYLLASIGIIASIISVYYYLRIIKIMYFDEIAIDKLHHLSKEVVLVSVICVLFNLLFFLYTVPLFKVAENAAANSISSKSNLIKLTNSD
ncbi:MAG: NADH-quinone oxidoreductase subunit N, partial [Pseudomonadota bacterium]